MRRKTRKLAEKLQKGRKTDKISESYENFCVFRVLMQSIKPDDPKIPQKMKSLREQNSKVFKRNKTNFFYFVTMILKRPKTTLLNRT